MVHQKIFDIFVLVKSPDADICVAIRPNSGPIQSIRSGNIQNSLLFCILSSSLIIDNDDLHFVPFSVQFEHRIQRRHFP
ncbi:hypothetical protein DERP_005194 [Dermatophagoides pteronyssinus]|uniref:Uncharacterized protein n=1 Tax=Dermatophagoides pteronyssinus TaxID=6956 RepID=A0ABQ8JM47_DERPT|nr:hypothetical protein DERP_005194 [Dermatophagoides pteronyssinus]